MRLEELILTMSGDEARLAFHDRLTVIGGLPETGRELLLHSVLGALAGDEDHAALLLTDALGRPVRAGADGTRFVDDDQPAPRIVGDIVSDRATLRRLMVLSAPDLGLPSGRPDQRDQNELVAARAARDQIKAEMGAPATATVDPAMRAELDALNERLRTADEAELRRAHWQAKTRLAEVQAELADLEELGETEAADGVLLAAADEILAHEKRRAELRRQIEERRAVVRAVVRVLDHPADMHGDGFDACEEGVEFAARADEWRQGVRHVRRLDNELAAHLANDPIDGLDRRIPLLAPLPQDELWQTHARVLAAEAAFADAMVTHDANGDVLAASVESSIDRAHVERVRAEDQMAARFRPGILGASVMAVAGLMLAPINPLMGAVLLAATAAVAAGMIASPWLRLGRATKREQAELAQVGADSYLGLHLRRLDDPSDAGAQTQLERLARDRTAAMIAWKELVGHLEPTDATEVEEQVRVHALRFNAELRARREAELMALLAEATTQRDTARTHLRDAAHRLEQSVEAAEQEIVAIGLSVDYLMTQLGIDIDTEDRAEAVAVCRNEAGKRQRRREELRPRAVVEADHRDLSIEVERLGRPEWDTPPPPAPATTGLSLLRRRRDELAKRIEEIDDRPAVLARRFEAVAKKVHDLEVRLGESVGAGDNRALAKRMLGHLARARHLGGLDESLPVVLDDPLVRVAVDRRCDLLDMLLRVGERMQLIYLTEDPVVVSWARQHRDAGVLQLVEPAIEAV